MKLPIEWLKDFIDLPDSVQELTDILVNLGIAVEGAAENVLDLEITANRGDLLSIVGIARDLHAKTGKELKAISVAKLPSGAPRIVLTVDPEFAPRYTTAVMRGVTVGPTKNPIITRRLKLAGMRPVNNIVDCTNYVMLELGQPTHAFDYHKVHGEKMSIRKAKKGEFLVTLDGVKRLMPDESYVICDSDRIIDLPGIMGGQNSEIDSQTSDVVLQAAAFDPIMIRKASKKLGLATEASYRFERHVDDGQCFAALGRLVELVQREAGGTLEGAIDLDRTSARRPIDLSLSEIERIIGRAYEKKAVSDVLQRLGCIVEGEKDTLRVIPPSWRPDLTISADLVEEVARVIGYDVITAVPLPVHKTGDSTAYMLGESLRDRLVEKGLSEVMTYSFVSKQDLAAAGVNVSDAVAIANPPSADLGYFRPGLLPGLMKAAAKNPIYDPIRIFEIGRVATKNGEGTELGILFGGKNAEALIDFVQEYGLTANEVTESLRDMYKIRKQEVYVATGQLGAAVQSIRVSSLQMPRRFTVKQISKFPPVSRDISVIVEASVRSDEIKMAIAKSSKSIYLVEQFDEFTGPKIGAGKKSIAFHIHYQDPERTMTSKEIDKLHKKVGALLEKDFAAKVR